MSSDENEVEIISPPEDRAEVDVTVLESELAAAEAKRSEYAERIEDVKMRIAEARTNLELDERVLASVTIEREAVLAAVESTRNRTDQALKQIANIHGIEAALRSRAHQGESDARIAGCGIMLSSSQLLATAITRGLISSGCGPRQFFLPTDVSASGYSVRHGKSEIEFFSSFCFSAIDVFLIQFQ